MSGEAVTKAIPGGSPGSTATQPLDDVMLAMDVVDTLRRRRRLVERELDAEGREQDLKQRLRKIYAAQGIEVPDHVLDEGVAALKEERFVYQPPPQSLATRLAHLYVSRASWGKWVLASLAALLVAGLIYQFTVVAPRSRLPERLEAVYQSVVELAESEEAARQAEQLYKSASAALRNGDAKEAKAGLKSLRELSEVLDQAYTLQIVSRPGERSGVWRVPDANPNARNYYIIVEAVAADGRQLQVPVVNEESGRTERVSQWGLRVEEDVFRRIAADKQDDGIIQRREFGVKRSGELQPDYRIPTTGAAITRW
jgi:anti-sigma-K factor RskA